MRAGSYHLEKHACMEVEDDVDMGTRRGVIHSGRRCGGRINTAHTSSTPSAAHDAVSVSRFRIHDQAAESLT